MQGAEWRKERMTLGKPKVSWMRRTYSSGSAFSSVLAAPGGKNFNLVVCVSAVMAVFARRVILRRQEFGRRGYDSRSFNGDFNRGLVLGNGYGNLSMGGDRLQGPARRRQQGLRWGLGLRRVCLGRLGTVQIIEAQGEKYISEAAQPRFGRLRILR